jgi:hypothetical protein
MTSNRGQGNYPRDLSGHELPLELRDQLPSGKAVRPRLAALAARNRGRRHDPRTRLRLALLDGHAAQRTARPDAEAFWGGP